MQAYWEAMCEAKVTDHVLDLDTANLVNKHGKNYGNSKLYVRDCYKPLADLLMEARAQNQNVVISNTPGVGKTAFRNFFVFYLAQRAKEASEGPFTIVLHGTPSQRAKTCTVLAMSGGNPSALRVPSKDLFKHVSREDPNVVYLVQVDVSKGNSDAVHLFPAGKIVMFTSPNEEAWKEFAKDGLYSGGPVFMPLWKKPELAAAAIMLGIDPTTDKFKENVTRFGGLPRAALEDHAYDRTIEDAFRKMDWSACTKNLGATDNTQGMRHRIVYYIVDEKKDGSYNFKDAELQFGTDYLLTRAADKYLEETNNAVDTVMGSKWPGVTPGEKGDFLEAVVHRSLCLSTDVQLRRLGHKSNKLFAGKAPGDLHLFDQAPQEWTWFDGVKAEDAVKLIRAALEQKKPLYLRPRIDQFPAVDAILVTASGKVLLLQVTISPRHSITGKKALPMLNKLVQLAPRTRLLWCLSCLPRCSRSTRSRTWVRRRCGST